MHQFLRCALRALSLRFVNPPVENNIRDVNSHNWACPPPRDANFIAVINGKQARKWLICNIFRAYRSKIALSPFYWAESGICERCLGPCRPRHHAPKSLLLGAIERSFGIENPSSGESPDDGPVDACDRLVLSLNRLDFCVSRINEQLSGSANTIELSICQSNL